MDRFEARKDLGENTDPDLQFVVWDNKCSRCGQAADAPDLSFECRDPQGSGVVFSRHAFTYTGPCYSETEARVITFALNAVADGKTLAAFGVDESGHWLDTKYAGPVEGLRRA